MSRNPRREGRIGKVGAGRESPSLPFCPCALIEPCTFVNQQVRTLNLSMSADCDGLFSCAVDLLFYVFLVFVFFVFPVQASRAL